MALRRQKPTATLRNTIPRTPTEAQTFQSFTDQSSSNMFFTS